MILKFKFKILWIGFILLMVTCLIASCKKPIHTELSREDKFSLNYGGFENELNLFDLNSNYTRANTQIFMKEGIFYIANSGGQKILKTSSFGDLLSIYYNPKTNSKPEFLENESNSESQSTTIKAIEYPFNHPCYLTLTEQKHLFVVDFVSEEKIEYDHEENIALKNIILHFDEHGNHINNIGQEGPNGTPYPTIAGIYTNSVNDLIVTCKTQTAIIIFWYNSNLDLIYKIPIFYADIPNPYEENAKVFSSIDKVVPSFNKNLVFVKIDYYTEKKDSETGASLGCDYDKSYMYFLNIKTGKYEKKIDIPAYEEKEVSQGEELNFKKVYELIGVSKNSWSYFYTPVQGGYALLLIDLKSQKRYNKNLTVANNEMFYNAFHLSETGIISAILAQKDKATITWWRLDKALGEN